MLVEIKEVIGEKEGKGGWKTVTIRIKALDKAAKQLGKQIDLSVAPDNKVILKKFRQLVIKKPQKFFGSYYFKLSDTERSKSKGNYSRGGGGSYSKPTSSSTSTKKYVDKDDEQIQLNYFVNSTMSIIAAKIESGDKKMLKLSNDELVEETLRMAKKLYKKIHAKKK